MVKSSLSGISEPISGESVLKRPVPFFPGPTYRLDSIGSPQRAGYCWKGRPWGDHIRRRNALWTEQDLCDLVEGKLRDHHPRFEKLPERCPLVPPHAIHLLPCWCSPAVKHTS